MSLPIQIRWMIRRDMPEVLAIESMSYPSDKAWTEFEFIETLRLRNCVGLVAEHDNRVVGYTVHLIHAKKLELLSVTVDPMFRLQGVGSQLIKKLFTKLTTRRPRLELMVADYNLEAQLFFKSLGLRAFRVERNAYGLGDDGYMMRYRMPAEVDCDAT